MLKLPLGAERNLPDRWKLWDHERSIGFVYPSVSGGDDHILRVHKASRDVDCDCQGFPFNGGVCRHVKLSIASLHKNAKKRKRGVQDTSLNAYWLLTREDLERSQKVVLSALATFGPICNREIAERICAHCNVCMVWDAWFEVYKCPECGGKVGKPINTITPRVNEGYKMGFIRDAGRKIDPVTNRTVIVWALEGDKDA